MSIRFMGGCFRHPSASVFASAVRRRGRARRGVTRFVGGLWLSWPSSRPSASAFRGRQRGREAGGADSSVMGGQRGGELAGGGLLTCVLPLWALGGGFRRFHGVCVRPCVFAGGQRGHERGGGADKGRGSLSWVFSSFVRVRVCVCCPWTWPSEMWWAQKRFVGGFASFLAVDVAEGFGYLPWVVSGVMSWQEGGV